MCTCSKEIIDNLCYGYLASVQELFLPVSKRPTAFVVPQARETEERGGEGVCAQSSACSSFQPTKFRTCLCPGLPRLEANTDRSVWVCDDSGGHFPAAYHEALFIHHLPLLFLPLLQISNAKHHFLVCPLFPKAAVGAHESNALRALQGQAVPGLGEDVAKE
eukprot:1161529-Pelagomonas_calceolata.AAC.1